MTKFDIRSASGYNEFLASVVHLQADSSFKSHNISEEEFSTLVKIEKRKAELLARATQDFIDSLAQDN